MFRGIHCKAIAGIFAVSLLASCQTSSGVSPDLPRLKQRAALPGPNATFTGILVERGGCLQVDGNGSTIVIWPRTANARTSPGGGPVIVIWPRSARIERRTGGWGTVVVVWPRAGGSGTPVRLGERVELDGRLIDDVSALPLDLPPSCRGPAFVASDFRPVAPGDLSLPRLRQGAPAPGRVTRRMGVLVREGDQLRIAGGGGGTVVIIWPFAATLDRGDGGGTTVIVWPRGTSSGTPIRAGDRIELSGYFVEDCASLPLAEPNSDACRGPAFVAQSVSRLN